MRDDRFRHLLRYDFAMGGRRSAGVGAAGLFLLIFLGQMNVVICRQADPKSGFWEYFRCFFYGAPRYLPEESGEFTLPVLWILFYLYGLFLVGGYPERDLKGCGRYVLWRCKDRGSWWFSKCIWAAVSEALFFMAAVGIVWIAGRMKGENNPGSVGDSVENLCMMLLPCVVLISLALVQMALSLLTSPIIAFLLSAAHLVVTVYWDTPFLIGNYGMTARTGAGDVVWWHGYLLAVAVSVSSVAAGWCFWRRKDIVGV